MRFSNDCNIIDVHAHFMPESYRRALADHGIASLDGGMPIPDWSAEHALATMSRHGVGHAVLSVSSPGTSLFPATSQAMFARKINEEGARLKADYPAHFGGFATLPMNNADAAIAETIYALDELKLDGVILLSSYNGTNISDSSFAPLLDILNDRNAIAFIHPTSPACPHCILSRPAPLIEFPFETTRTVVDLIYSGTIARYPRIRFILAHGGGALPFLAQRIAGFSALPVAKAVDGVSPPAVMAQLATLYYDTALSTSPAQMFGLRQLTCIDRILFGSDWPFSPENILGASVAAIRSSDLLDAGEREAVLSGNARRLLAHQLAV